MQVLHRTWPMLLGPASPVTPKHSLAVYGWQAHMLLFGNLVLLASNRNEISPTFDLLYKIQTRARILISVHLTHVLFFQMTNTEAEIIQKKNKYHAQPSIGKGLFCSGFLFLLVKKTICWRQIWQSEWYGFFLAIASRLWLLELWPI